MRTATVAKIIMIVTKLPPAIDGVGDYSLMLARQLYRQAGVQTTFIVADPNWRGESMIEGFPVHVLRTRSSAVLAQQLTRLADVSTLVLLQFSGYGYARHGLCDWLIQGLRQWKANCANARLITMFHELFIQPSHPLSKQFWIHHLQKKIAGNLLRLSDDLMTNADVHVAALNALQQGREILNLPIPSNVGEPRSLPLIADRRNQMVLFGQEGTRRRAYENSSGALQSVCEKLEIETIIDIGTPIDIGFQHLGQVPIVQMGKCSEARISQILSESKVAFLDYGDSRYLAKSGVFAAYCAHRVVPIVAQPCPRYLDNLRLGINYLAVEESAALTSLQSVADAAYEWYNAHNVNVQTQVVLAKINRLLPCPI